MKPTVFWDVVPCSLLETGVLQVLTASIIALILEAVNTLKRRSVSMKLTPHNMAEDSRLHIRLRHQTKMLSCSVTGFTNAGVKL
jgi:hypothetical protein